MSNDFIGHKNLFEAFEAFLSQWVGSTDVLPTVEYLWFSGKAEDVQVRDAEGDVSSDVLLRLYREGHRGDDGEPVKHEIWARIASLGGYWFIPRHECYLLVVAPAHGGNSHGVPMVFTGGADGPPRRLSRDQAMQVLPDEVTLATKAGGFAWLSALKSFFTIDKETGVIALGGPNGTHIRLDPTNNVISLGVFDGQTPNNLLAGITLDATGPKLVSHDPATGKKQIWHLEASSGNFIGVGTGKFFAMYPNGTLGKAPTTGIGNVGLTSTKWYVEAP